MAELTFSDLRDHFDVSITPGLLSPAPTDPDFTTEGISSPSPSPTPVCPDIFVGSHLVKRGLVGSGSGHRKDLRIDDSANKIIPAPTSIEQSPESMRDYSFSPEEDIILTPMADRRLSVELASPPPELECEDRQYFAEFLADSLHGSPLPESDTDDATLDKPPKMDGAFPLRDLSDTPTTAWSDGDCVFNIDDDYQNEAAHMGGELSISDIDEKYNRRLAKARIVSYVGFCFAIVQGSVAMGFGIKHGVISLTAMGAQIMIDLLSSVMVIWRFYTRSDSTRRNPRHADANTRLKEALREKRAARGVGVLLIATSVWAASWAFVKVFGVPPPPDERLTRAQVTMGVAWPGFLLCSVIASLKWNYALKIRSRVLQKDAVCSTFGAALSFISAVFATIDYNVHSFQSNTGAADSVAALIMAALLMVEGFRTIYQNTVGWVPPNGVPKETIDAHFQARRAEP